MTTLQRELARLGPVTVWLPPDVDEELRRVIDPVNELAAFVVGRRHSETLIEIAWVDDRVVRGTVSAVNLDGRTHDDLRERLPDGLDLIGDLHAHTRYQPEGPKPSDDDGRGWLAGSKLAHATSYIGLILAPSAGEQLDRRFLPRQDPWSVPVVKAWAARGGRVHQARLLRTTERPRPAPARAERTSWYLGGGRQSGGGKLKAPVRAPGRGGWRTRSVGLGVSWQETRISPTVVERYAEHGLPTVAVMQGAT